MNSNRSVHLSCKLLFMKLYTTLLSIVIITASAITFTAFTSVKAHKKDPVTSNKLIQQKIQVAILLDVSSSMDGLIDQAKAQLWNMVNTMGKVKCTGDASPKIEIALYEYGRTGNDAKNGYVKLINGFINDLDSLSQNLFSLKTNGGEEYCGKVIYNSLNELTWDPAPENYKVIFIAGNEDFLQGDVQYTQSCGIAKQKGVIVNTIYCGDRIQGIREHWNLAGECGNGSFTNINQNAKEKEIPTPYDSTLYVLNDKLNGTYIGYGRKAAYAAQNQARQDGLNSTMSKSQGIKRIAAKGNAKVYNNSNWDLVDAAKEGEVAFEKISKDELPDSLKNKTRAELKQFVDTKSKERAAIQQQIVTVNTQRENYIAAEKAKNANTKNEATLETEVEKMIKEQVKRYNMSVQ